LLTWEIDKKAKEVLVDTTLQEKNITYPTDAKLYKINQLRARKGIRSVNKQQGKQGKKYEFGSKVSIVSFRVVN
jgi:hypothetical protein